MYISSEYASPVGRLTLAAAGGARTGLWIEGQKYFAAGHELRDISGAGGADVDKGSIAALYAARKWLDAYFAAGRPDARALPLAPEGGEFRCAVWELLLDIPYGAVVTYGELAARYEARTGRKTSPRAIGGAVGHNPVSIIIPCHRVVGADGSLTGYAGGVERKRWLLAHEQAAR